MSRAGRPRARRAAARSTAAALALALAIAGASPGRGQPLELHELEAVFLYNFTKFVEWPAEVFAAADAPFRICLVGGDPRLRELLETLVEGEVTNGRRLEVRRLVRVREGDQCQILFVPASHDPGHLPSVLGSRARSVLTVGEAEDFLAAGGLLQLYRKDDRVRLRLNETERERSKLRLSARLVQLCERVRPSVDGRESRRSGRAEER